MSKTTDKKTKVPLLKELSSCLTKAQKEGYTEDFMVREGILVSRSDDREFQAENVRVVNFYREEGISDPEDNSILYLIETSDGIKGTLSDAYGAYSDPQVDEFIKQVEDIQKKVDKKA